MGWLEKNVYIIEWIAGVVGILAFILPFFVKSTIKPLPTREETPKERELRKARVNRNVGIAAVFVEILIAVFPFPIFVRILAGILALVLMFVVFMGTPDEL